MDREEINARDDLARKNRVTVACVICGQIYYPGVSEDKDRPRDSESKLVRVSHADIKGFCSKRCQHERTF